MATRKPKTAPALEQAAATATKEGFAWLVAKHGKAEKPSEKTDEYSGRIIPCVVDSSAKKEYVLHKQAIMLRVLNELKSPHAGRLFMVDISPAEEAIMPKVEKEESKVAKVAPEKEKKTTGVEILGGGTLRKGSVLHAIYRSWDLKAGSTKEETLDRLCDEFPDRSRDSMTYTVNTQITELPKKHGFELGRDDNGRYGIHIQGRSTKRVVSPERQAALDAKEKDKKAKAELKLKAAKDREAAKAKAKKDKEGVAKAKVDGSGRIVKPAAEASA